MVSLRNMVKKKFWVWAGAIAVVIIASFLLAKFWSSSESVTLISILLQIGAASLAVAIAILAFRSQKKLDGVLSIVLAILGCVAIPFSLQAAALQSREQAKLSEYGTVATWNYQGAQSLSKDYSLPGPISGWVDNYVEDTPTGKQIRFDDEAIAVYQDMAKNQPKYPFSYYFLAEAYRLRNNNELAYTYAKQAIEIFEITTRIPNHSPDHDDALNNMKIMLPLVSPK